MKAFKLFSMAALALIMGACSEEVAEQNNQAPEAKSIHFKATIGPADGCDVTRTTYTYDGTTINVKWKEDDQIALLHNGYKDVATVKSVATDGTATVECIFTNPVENNEEVKLVYPAASVESSGSGTGHTANLLYAAKGLNQDGTLKYIADYLDSRQSNGTAYISVSGSEATLKDNVTMVSNICIWELNLTTNGTTPLNAKSLTLKLGGQTIAQAANGSGSAKYYMCVVPQTLATIYTSLPTAPFVIEAGDGTDTYLYTLAGGTTLTLATNTYYNSTLTMLKEGNLYNIVATGTINGSSVDGELTKQTLPASTNISTLLGTGGGMISVSSVTLKSGDNIEIVSVDGSSINVTGAGTAVLTVNYSYGMGSGSDDITVIVSKMPVATGKALSAAAFKDVLCTDKKFYDSSDLDNLPSGVTPVALVAYKSGDNGLAIALADIPDGDYSSAFSACNNLNTTMNIGGATWGIPSTDQWQDMINSFTYLGGWSGFQAAAKLTSHNYWTSTDQAEYQHYLVDYTDGNMLFGDSDSNAHYCRAVLVW